jgi:hypothetical protein
MAANTPHQSLHDFVSAFNSSTSPKEALRLVQDTSKVLTAYVTRQPHSLEVHCTCLAGTLVEECSLPVDASVAELAAKLARTLSKQAEVPMTMLTLFADEGSEVDVTGCLRDHSRLTVKAGLSPDDFGRLMHKAESSVNVELLGECLGNHGEFWKQVALAYPKNFACFAGMDIVEAIRAYLWRFRLPGEAAQIERIIDGFAQSYYHFNSSPSDREHAVMENGTAQDCQEQAQHHSCWDAGVQGWYVNQPLSGPKQVACCAHCGALDGEAGDLVVCKGCEVVHFCRRCRKNASKYGHAVVGMIGYGRACVAARIQAESLGPDWKIVHQQDLSGAGAAEMSVVSEDSKQWALVSPFRSQDSVMVLAYSIIMLTTNLHSANVKDKMKKHEFIKQNMTINEGANFPGDFLSKIFDDIQREELKVRRQAN